MELLYVWIEDNLIENLEQDFCFTPEFDIHFDKYEEEIIIKKIDDLNIFKKNNITNISVIVGENGTGKTTILNRMTIISQSLYGVNPNDSQKGRYIAVFNDDGKFKIYNLTNRVISYNGYKIYEYNCFSEDEDFQSKDILPSRIFISNSEFSKNGNFINWENVDYLYLTNKEIRLLGREYFREKGTIKINSFSCSMDNVSRERSKLFVLQEIFSEYVIENFQALIDIDFFEYLKQRKINFIGKKAKNVRFEMHLVSDVINDDVNKAVVFDGKKDAEILKKFENNFFDLEKKYKKNNLYSKLVINLLGELVFCYPEIVNQIYDYSIPVDHLFRLG